MNKIFVLLVVCLMVGCVDGKRAQTKKSDLVIECLDGVNYYLFRESTGNMGFGYMSPKYKRDGSVSLCDYEY